MHPVTAGLCLIAWLWFVLRWAGREPVDMAANGEIESQL